MAHFRLNERNDRVGFHAPQPQTRIRLVTLQHQLSQQLSRIAAALFHATATVPQRRIHRVFVNLPRVSGLQCRISIRLYVTSDVRKRGLLAVMRDTPLRSIQRLRTRVVDRCTFGFARLLMWGRHVWHGGRVGRFRLLLVVWWLLLGVVGKVRRSRGCLSCWEYG